MVGQTAGLGNPIAAAGLAVAAPLAYEQRERVALGVPFVLGALPNPALLQTMIGGAVAFRAREPKLLPIEALRPELLKETINKRAKVLAFGERRNPMDPRAEGEKGDVTRFIEELKKLSDEGKPKDKAAVEKYIKEFIAARGLTHFGASTDARDEWSLEDDPKLAALVDAQKMSLLLARGPHGGEYMPFGRSFFWKDDFDFNTFSTRRSATNGLYVAETYPPQEPEARPGQPRYVVWRTEDIAPRGRSLPQALDDVKAAWRRIKARELAQKEANAIADKIRADGATNDVALERPLNDLYYGLLRDVRDPKVVSQIRKFRIDNVAPLVVSFPQMRRFAITESNDIPYPTPEMTTALLDNRDKGFKTVLVLPDAPKDTYYVAALTNRTVKRPDDFRTDVFSPIGQAREILDLYRADTVKKARDSVVELLKKEFKYEETEEQKKKLDENAKSGSRGDE
jgi:hypothetical protein